MVHGIRAWLGIITGVLFLGMSFLPMLGINALSFGRISIYALYLGTVLLLLDAFHESPMLKTPSLVLGILLLAFIVLPFAGLGVPSFLSSLYQWIVGFSGLLLLAGSFVRGY